MVGCGLQKAHSGCCSWGATRRGDGKPLGRPGSHRFESWDVPRRGSVDRGARGAPGYTEAHCCHGRLPWAQLFQPTIALLRGGHVVAPVLSQFLHNGFLRPSLQASTLW